jgi:hypothetical protein
VEDRAQQEAEWLERREEIARLDANGATQEIDVTLENGGRIPTALEQAKQVKIVRPDTVQITLPVGAGTVVGQQRRFFLNGNQRLTVPIKLKLGATPPD